MHHLVLSCAKDVMPNESAVAVHYLHVADRWACGDGLAARDSAVDKSSPARAHELRCLVRGWPVVVRRSKQDGKKVTGDGGN